MSESDFDPSTTERKVKKTPKKKHRSANDSGVKFHNTRVSIRNVPLATGTTEGGGGGEGGSHMLNYRIILSRRIQIKIFLSLCASIRNVLFATDTIGQGFGFVWGDFL